jgi:hypothetical protein
MVTKKLRFTVFVRDNFTCQYCGRKPPEVKLQIDHTQSIKDGGTDDIQKLITSCEDCNLGKGSASLTITTPNIDRENLDPVQDFWINQSGGKYALTLTGLETTHRLAIRYSDMEVYEAIRIAWANDKVRPSAKFKYMIGVLKKREEQFRIAASSLLNGK